MQANRVLFIDAYDSFSNSIIALLRSELSITVDCIRIDDARFVLNDEAFYEYLHGFYAVVAGPGPGHPQNTEDVGLIGKLWTLPEEHVLPVLGICLGFQSLCLAFGATIERLKEPRHGIMAMITHCSKDVYAGTGKIVVTQYHSLHVSLQQQGTGDAWGACDLWKPSKKCAQLLPLAWSLMNVTNGPTLMGIRHRERPFWGVQYHPESICTNKEGQKLIRNWWEAVCDWRGRDSGLPSPVSEETREFGVDEESDQPQLEYPTRKVQWRTVQSGLSADVAAIVEQLRTDGTCPEPMLLESGSRNGQPVNSATGRFSIIGLPEPSSNQIRYSTNTRYLDAISESKIVFRKQTDVKHAFSYIDEVMKANRAVAGPPSSPFWGGLIGFFSYEAGLETINVPDSDAKAAHPDIWFTFIDRSIVVDHVEGVAYVQSMSLEDRHWMEAVQSSLQKCFEAERTSAAPLEQLSAEVVGGPEKGGYCQKVLDCQANLRAGESYELCLTDQSTLHTSADAWTMYCKLRTRNPAPFSAFLRMKSHNSPGISVVGSSPERFLSWTRQGKCQFRPIKGTVKKAPGVTRAKAEEILGSAKERAENLMIVDLIRHDLAGVPGVKEVRVPKLMSVEEYETVFQLVSVIEGDAHSGAAALAASLPPGSMTGAPKKRSCELLKELECGKPRGLYSGVLGYFDVGGGGDFSVVIRTAFKWDDEGEDWHVGAGGAITALSEPEAEWEEMITKRESVLNSLLL